MAAPDHIRIGDFAPVARRQILRGGDPLELPEGVSVRLRVRREGQSTATEYVGEVEDRALGWVRYRWQSGEPVPVSITEPVVLWMTFEVSAPGIGRITVPTVGEDAIVVHPRGP